MNIINCKPFSFDPVIVQLHHFAETSEPGCGIVLLTTGECKRRIPLLFHHEKIYKSCRIMRKVATIAVKTNKMFMTELDMTINRVVFWTDSMAVLYKLYMFRTERENFILS